MAEDETYIDVLAALADERIPFRVHFPTDNAFVVTVKETLSSDQLRALTSLNASMSGGEFHIMGPVGL